MAWHGMAPNLPQRLLIIRSNRGAGPHCIRRSWYGDTTAASQESPADHLNPNFA